MLPPSSSSLTGSRPATHRAVCAAIMQSPIPCTGTQTAAQRLTNTCSINCLETVATRCAGHTSTLVAQSTKQDLRCSVTRMQCEACLVKSPEPWRRSLEGLVRLERGPAAVGGGGDAQAREQGRRLRSHHARFAQVSGGAHRCKWCRPPLHGEWSRSGSCSRRFGCPTVLYATLGLPTAQGREVAPCRWACLYNPLRVLRWLNVCSRCAYHPATDGGSFAREFVCWSSGAKTCRGCNGRCYQQCQRVQMHF